MKKSLVHISVIIILFVVGFVFSIFCYEEAYVTSVLHYNDNSVFTSYTSGPLMSGKSIHGEFVASENNLATVKVRIQTFNRINTTHILFKLKQKGEKNWSVENTYATDRDVDGLFYPFGFPAFKDSLGKSYEFEITSIDGTEDNAVGFVNGYHTVATQYVFLKSSLLSDRGSLVNFLKSKLNTIFEPYYLLYLALFFIPLIAYITHVMSRKKKGKLYIYGILCIYLFFTYTYLPVTMHGNTILYVALTCYFVGYLASVTSSIIFTAALICLINIPVALFFNTILVADRAATFVFFLLLIGCIRLGKEIYFTRRYE